MGAGELEDLAEAVGVESAGADAGDAGLEEFAGAEALGF